MLHLKKDVGHVYFMEVTNLKVRMYINNVNVVFLKNRTKMLWNLKKLLTHMCNWVFERKMKLGSKMMQEDSKEEETMQ